MITMLFNLIIIIIIMMILYVNSFNNNIRFKYTSSYSLSRILRISRQMSSSDEDLGMISKVYHYYQLFKL
jgi:hypothetical protein